MPDCTLDALEGLHNVTLETTAAFWYCDSPLWECMLAWDWWWHNCKIVLCEQTPCGMIALCIVLWDFVSHLSEYSVQNPYTPPLDCCPAFWHLLTNIHDPQSHGYWGSSGTSTPVSTAVSSSSSLSSQSRACSPLFFVDSTDGVVVGPLHNCSHHSLN